MRRAFIHASEILTGSGIRRKDGRQVTEVDMGRISDGALVYSYKRQGNLEVPGQIEWVGPTSQLPKKWKDVPKKNLKRQQAIIPGLVDCHNHLIFAGDRSDEFAARCAGATYQEIAQRGGGIQATVRETRSASQKDLLRLAIPRLKELYSYGIRIVEIKSGYGLSKEAELKILGVIPQLRRLFPQMTLSATFLGAHAFPSDKPREEYLRILLEEMLPEVVEKKLADSCDVFIDDGYFTLEEGERILKAAQNLGLRVKIHADELSNSEAASLAVKMGALSADHLLKISEEGISKIANSNTVAVLLPGTAFYLKADYAPARKLLDSGACVALATDFNPGTCMCLSLPSLMTIAALYLKMSAAEIFAGVTYNGAKALGLEKMKGTLEAGLDADFFVLPFRQFEEVYYRFGWSASNK